MPLPVVAGVAFGIFLRALLVAVLLPITTFLVRSFAKIFTLLFALFIVDRVMVRTLGVNLLNVVTYSLNQIAAGFQVLKMNTESLWSSAGSYLAMANSVAPVDFGVQVFLALFALIVLVLIVRGCLAVWHLVSKFLS